jgi:hypothetical protein
MLRRALILGFVLAIGACSSNPEEGELSEPLQGAGIIFVSEPAQSGKCSQGSAGK